MAILNAELREHIKMEFEVGRFALVPLTRFELAWLVDSIQLAITQENKANSEAAFDSETTVVLEKVEYTSMVKSQIRKWLEHKFSREQPKADTSISDLKKAWESSGEFTNAQLLQQLSQRYSDILQLEELLDGLKQESRELISLAISYSREEKIAVGNLEFSITRPYSYTRFNATKLKGYLEILQRSGRWDEAAALRKCQEEVQVAGTLKVEKRK